MEPSDEELMGRTADGDRAAFGELVDRHQAALFRFARAASRTEAQAEDVLQETFLAAFRRASTYRGDAAVRSWLLSIARHKAQRAGRLRAGEPRHFEALDSLGVAAGWGAEGDPEEAAMAAERRETLTTALEALGPEDRQLLVLRDLEGLSGEEAASVLDISLAAQKSRLHRARLRFAAALRGLGGDAHGP